MFPITLTRPITWFDLETTGIDPKTARIVEIGVTQLRPDGEHVNYHTLVNPGVLIPAGATAKHGITDEMVVGKPRFEDLAPKLSRAFSNCDFGGFNLKRYDIEVMAAEFRRARIEWSADDACVLDGHRLWQILFPRTLTDAVREFLGREPSEAHRATGDATDALEVVSAMLEKFPEALPRDLKALHELQFPSNPNAIDKQGKVAWNEAGDAVLTFGKHKDVPLAKVPRSYLDWLLSTDMAFDTRTILTNAKQGRFPTRG